MPKPKTNEEVVRDLMIFSRCGALQQVFILTAIEKYAQMCIEAGAAKFDSPMMHGKAWIACAEEARDTIRKHLSE